jgi:DNA-binding MarR family transcriptional regulator
MTARTDRHRLGDADYARLLAFRTELRRFLRWTEDNAAEAQLTPLQHQLLLAIRGHRGGAPSIKEVAGYLFEKQHSVSELVDRAARAGLVRRAPDPDDHRVVRLSLTAKGSRKLALLSALHLEELARLGPLLAALANAV